MVSLESVIVEIVLTIRSLCSLRVKRASSSLAVVFLNLCRVTADEVMWLCKASSNTKLVKSGLTPYVLFPDPSTFNEISLTRSNASPLCMVEMGLSSENVLVDVASRMGDNSSSQENGRESLREVNHDDFVIVVGIEENVSTRPLWSRRHEDLL